MSSETEGESEERETQKEEERTIGHHQSSAGRSGMLSVNRLSQQEPGELDTSRHLKKKNHE